MDCTPIAPSPTRKRRPAILAAWLGLVLPCLQAQAPISFQVTAPDYRLECFPRLFAPGQRPLLLALGGGGGKGLTHAGLLQRLQEEGIPVSGIAGTSAGAFLGAMYATGYSGFAIETFMETRDLGALLIDRQHRGSGETLWEQENERITFLSLEIKPGSKLTFSPGTSSGHDLKRTLQLLLSRGGLQADASFDRLRVPFRAVSTDLQAGRAYAPAHGELATAVQASMSIPGLYKPVTIEGHLHVDGGLVQNLPVETARSLNPDGAVLAMEVGEKLSVGREDSVLGLAVDAVNVSIEDRTEISRRAADLLFQPRTEAFSGSSPF